MKKLIMIAAAVMMVLALGFVPAVPVSASPSWQLVGTYTVNYRYNAAGAPWTTPQYHPWVANYIAPGPYFLDPALTPVGKYKTVVTAEGVYGGNANIWDGNALVGTRYGVGGVGYTVEFEHTYGQIVLYATDWYPWDNPDTYWTTVELWRSVISVITVTAPNDITVEGNTTGGATGVALGTAVASGGTPPYTITNNAPAFFPLGDTTVTWTVTDASSSTATDTQTVKVEDTTPPTITVVGSLPVIVGAPSSVLPPPSVSDIVDPGPTVTSNTPSFFPLGNTVVTWTAKDASGNSATATTTVTAVYNFGGFLPPLVINGAGTGHFKAGSTIPVKFQLTDYNGNPVSTASGTASINTAPAASADIRYDATAMQYIGNLKTPKGAAPATYTITVELNDGSSHTIAVTLQ